MMSARNSRQPKSHYLLVLLIGLAGLAPLALTAGIIDVDSPQDDWLDSLSAPLDSVGIDVMRNLNHRQLARARVNRPRLGRFPDIPVNHLPGSDDLNGWELHFRNGEIGALAINATPPVAGVISAGDFYQTWLGLSAQRRVFVSFAMADLDSAQNLISVLVALGYQNQFMTLPAEIETAGRLYATAGQRLAIDSADARKIRSDVSEFSYLGERVQRDSNSLFVSGSVQPSSARNEPARFRKQSLGDEYTASSIEEIIVPGGIALGELAVLSFTATDLEYRDGRFFLHDDADAIWALPMESVATVKALFDFVSRSIVRRSDAVVDIDGEGRVKIAAEIRDTDVGYEFIQIDTQPFNFVRQLSVTKSVIIDKSVRFSSSAVSNSLAYTTEYEVRFLSADTMRIAQTRAALEYLYNSETGQATHVYNWGRDVPRLDKNLDFTGLGSSTAAVARFAAWAALFRTVQENQIAFLLGRYEFMKIDKSGRRTPSRF